MAPSITAILAGLTLVGSTACVAVVNQQVLNSELGPVTDRSAIGRIAPAAGESDSDGEDNEAHELVKSDVLVHLKSQSDEDADEAEDAADEAREASAAESEAAEADELEHSAGDVKVDSSSSDSLTATEEPSDTEDSHVADSSYSGAESDD